MLKKVFMDQSINALFVLNTEMPPVFNGNYYGNRAFLKEEKGYLGKLCYKVGFGWNLPK